MVLDDDGIPSLSSHAYDRIIGALERQPHLLRNSDRWAEYGIALLCVDRPADAVKAFANSSMMAIEELGTGVAAFSELHFAALWLAGRPRDAAKCILNLVDSITDGSVKFVDASGGLRPGFLLHFTGIELNNSELLMTAKKYLLRRSKSQMAQNWPGPILGLLQGQVDAQSLWDKYLGLAFPLPPAPLSATHREIMISILFYLSTMRSRLTLTLPSDECLRRCVGIENTFWDPEWYLACAKLGISCDWKLRRPN